MIADMEARHNIVFLAALTKYLFQAISTSAGHAAVYDYQFINSDGCVFNKLIFVNW